MPAVSVVIPTYRPGRYLREAISSVVGQSMIDWELLLVDNASGVDLAPFVTDPRIRVITESHPGAAWARNAGIGAATGDFVALLDEDDVWLPRKLERQLEAMRSHPTASLCHSAVAVIDDGGELLHNKRGTDVSYRGILADRGMMATSSLLVRKEVIRGVGGYDITFANAEDFDLALRLLYSCEPVYIDEVLVEYRLHPDNRSRGYVNQGHQALRALADNRRRALLQKDWQSWRASWQGTISKRHGYARNAFSRSYRSHRAGQPLTMVAWHLAQGLKFSPPTLLFAVLEHFRTKSSPAWIELDSWERAGMEAASKPRCAEPREKDPSTDGENGTSKASRDAVS